MPSKKPSQGKPQTDDAASQLPLDLGEFTLAAPVGKLTKGKQKDAALTAPGRIERVTSRDEFEAAITALGGDALCIQNATGAMYRVAFKMTATKLYQYYKVKEDRDFLPLVVQRIIQIHEILNAEKLRQQRLPESLQDQSEINSHIVLVVKRQTEHTEIYLATFQLFGKGVQLGQKKAALKTQPSISVETEYGPIECEVLEAENDADIPF